MGNFICPPPVAQPLASLARDICPFPHYTPNPLVCNMLLYDSSQRLSDHYRDVQNSLNPSQLESFTRSLRTIIGREGKVTMGGVGVVALSLALLFDTLAREVRGEWVPESGPIPGLFLKDVDGNPHPFSPVVSEYLRLVPYIANNPTMMREETERYYWLMKEISKQYEHNDQNNSKVHFLNTMLGFSVMQGLHYLIRLNNSSRTEEMDSWVLDKRPILEHNSLEALKFSFNCDVEAVNKVFLQEAAKSGQIRDMLKECSMDVTESHYNALQVVALHNFIHVITPYHNPCLSDYVTLRVQSEDFDLKAKAHLHY